MPSQNWVGRVSRRGAKFRREVMQHAEGEAVEEKDAL